MTGRLQELALQAGATFTKGYIELSDDQLLLSDNADVNHTNIDLAKFAELIVEECAKVAVEAESTGVARLIMIHFGVEK